MTTRAQRRDLLRVAGHAEILSHEIDVESGRLAAVVAAAVAIITAAIVIPLSLGGSQITPAPVTVVIPLHATAAAKLIGDGAATARATARQAGPSWTFDMTVHGLKVLPGNDVYECCYATSGSTQLHPLLVSGGTFVVDNSGSNTVTMTTGVDPRQFRTMEITAESPGNGAIHGTVILTGQATFEVLRPYRLRPFVSYPFVLSRAARTARRRIIFQASGWPIRFPVRVVNSGPAARPPG